MFTWKGWNPAHSKSRDGVKICVAQAPTGRVWDTESTNLCQLCRNSPKINKQNPPRAWAGPSLWFDHDWKDKKEESITLWIFRPRSQLTSINDWCSYSCWAVLRGSLRHLEGEGFILCWWCWSHAAPSPFVPQWNNRWFCHLPLLTALSKPRVLCVVLSWVVRPGRALGSISSSHHSNRPSAGLRNSQISLSANKELGFFCLAIRGDKFSP